MQIIYDGYDFLYYPEFKLYERPYLLLEYDTSLGTSILVFSKTGANDTKNLAYLKIGESIWLKDYNTFYTITTVQDAVDTITIYVDRDLEEEYFQNDIIVFNEKKYELQSNSNILNDSTTNTLSPFKFKFINEFDSKTWFMANNIGKSNNFTLVNNDFTNILDL
jgi:hypothetical protein